MKRLLTRAAGAATFVAVIFCTACGGAAAPASVPAIPASVSASPSPDPVASSAVIETSASTNTQAFSIYVTRSAVASKSYGTSVTQISLDPALTQRFFADLDAARPVSSLPAISCAKPASFAVSTRVVYAGASSPDISCGGGPATLSALTTDVEQITTAVGGVPWN